MPSVGKGLGEHQLAFGKKKPHMGGEHELAYGIAEHLISTKSLHGGNFFHVIDEGIAYG